MSKTYELSDMFNFITDRYRKIKLKLYKKKKVKASTTSYMRTYHVRYRISIDDEHNPQTSDQYETLVPARAAFFAKIMLERSIKEKVYIEVDSIDEMSDEEHDEFLKSQQAHLDTLN
jgi:hypothetical protein